MGTKDWGPADERRHEPADPRTGEVVVTGIRVPFWNLVNLAISVWFANIVATLVLAPILLLVAFVGAVCLGSLGR